MCIFQTDLNEQLFHTAPANSFRNRPRPIQKPNRNDDKYSTNLTNKRANLSNRSNKEEYKKSPNYSLSPFLFFYNKAEKSGIKKKKGKKKQKNFLHTPLCKHFSYSFIGHGKSVVLERTCFANDLHRKYVTMASLTRIGVKSGKRGGEGNETHAIGVDACFDGLKKPAKIERAIPPPPTVQMNEICRFTCITRERVALLLRRMGCIHACSLQTANLTAVRHGVAK